VPTIDVWLTVVHGVTDTTAKDFHRSEKVFVHVRLKFKVKKFILNKDQTKAILGTDGKLALTGGPTEFDHDLPAGAGSPAARPMTVKDPNGRFSTEVWAAIKNWTDLGGLHVFYVPDFDSPGLEGGICLRMDDQIDPIIFVSQKANVSLLSLTKGARGILEHEIGHAFGLKDIARSNTLMNGIVSSDGSDAGTSLSQDEMTIIASSRLLGLATATEAAHRQSR
jgi:hypothetical protein